MWRKLILLGLVSGIAGAVVLFKIQERKFTDRIAQNRKHLESHFPAILKDLELLQRTSPFHDGPRNKDAQKYISEHVSWEGHGFTPLASVEHKLLKELFEQHKSGTKSTQDLMALARDPRLEKINTDWLEGLHQFDHWNFASHPAIQHQLSLVAGLNGIARIGVWASLPIPNYKELRQWALVHLIKKHKAGKSIEGLKTFRKAGELAHSSNTLIGNMIAAVFLKSELLFTTGFKIQGWKAAGPQTSEAYKRVSWAMAGALALPASGEVPQAFQKYLSPRLGICAGVNESLMHWSGIQDFLRPQFPFESGFSELYARDAEWRTSLNRICGNSHYDVFLSPTPPEANPWRVAGMGELMSMSGDLPTGPSINYARIPYLRRLVGLVLMSIAVPSYTRLYEDLGKKPRQPASSN